MRTIKILTVIILASLVSQTACCNMDNNGEVNNNDKADIVLAEIEITPDYDIGVGWIPFDKSYSGVAREKINLRSSPTTNAEIVKTIDKGTVLEIVGTSVACSLVMTEQEWEDYIVDLRKPADDYEEDMMRIYSQREMYWYRVKSENGYSWAHAAFIETLDDSSLSTIPSYVDTAGSNGIAYNFDNDGKLFAENAENLEVDIIRTHVVPFASVPTDEVDGGWVYLRTQYFGQNPGEPAYDIRRCTPKAFNLHRNRELGKETPGWFTKLSDNGLLISDYIDVGDVIWVTDISQGKAIKVDKNGTVLVSYDNFALPLHITTDGEGGVWVADYSKRIIHLNASARPVAEITNIKTKALHFDQNGNLWVYAIELNDSWGGYLQTFDANGIQIDKTHEFENVSDGEGEFRNVYLDTAFKASFEEQVNGTITLYLCITGQ